MAGRKGGHHGSGKAKPTSSASGKRRTQAAASPTPKRKELSPETVDRAKHEIIFGERVGHKHPPRATQFKKGQSGNPKGRPKKATDTSSLGETSITDIVLKEGARKVTIREGDETREIPAIEAVSRAQYLLAIKGGSAYAQKHIIERHDRAERERKRERDADIEFWSGYKEKMGPLIAEAEKSGEPPPDIFPHPDDVVIDYLRGVRIVGPLDQEGAESMDALVKLRDAHIMQHALDVRMSDDPDGPDQPGTALLIADLIERSLPPRLRLPDGVWLMRLMRDDETPKRQLLKELHKAWREAGWPRRRGWTYPPQWWGVKFVGALFDFGAAAMKGETNLTEHIHEINAVMREWFGRKRSVPYTSP
jgi:hypothetical protein